MDANIVCPRCGKPLRPELDPYLQRAFLGKCVECEWPFTLSIRLEEAGRAYVPPQTETTKAAAAAGAKGAKRVEFYYSSAQKSGELFPCDNARALEQRPGRQRTPGVRRQGGPRGGLWHERPGAAHLRG